MSDSIIVSGVNKSDITVIVDTQGPSFNYITNMVQLKNELQEKIDKYTIFQTISTSLIETIDEVDTVQNVLSSEWQKTTETFKLGVADGGFF
jgi:hypothetical protein